MAGGLRKISLTLREPGVVQVEIVTSPTLGTLPGEREDGTKGDFTPDEYLPEPYCCRFQTLGDEGGWRYPSVEISVLIARIWTRHCFDMSQVSGDRRMVEAIAASEQIEVPVLWVNEGVTGTTSIKEKTRNSWGEAVRRTVGISAAQWIEELEQSEWEQSESWRPGPRPRPYRRRTTEPPEGVSLPFFARRSGVLPKDGGVTVGGIELPEGQRRPDRPAAYWVSDGPVEDLESIAPALAERFAETGLWPLLWRSREDPASYMSARGPIDLIDDVDLAAALSELWKRHPGAAADPEPSWDLHTTGPADPAAPSRPFPDRALETPARILLVPCNRPADAITAVGGVASEVDQLVLSALLRSWEARFLAVVYEVGPGLLRLGVGRAPSEPEAALELAREILAISHDGSDLAQHTPGQIADDLMHGEHDTTRSRTSRGAWDVSV
jgi:Domain of unknown function (DUF4253)